MHQQIAIPFGAQKIDLSRLIFELSATAQGIARLTLHRNHAATRGSRRSNTGLVEKGRKELSEYFCGRRSYFSVAVDLSGLVGFDVAALRIAAAIPYGEVRTYRSIAEQLGNPEAARAVGHAMAINPVAVIIPCHRVIKSDGGLGGYAFGLDVKEALLEMERSTPALVGCASTRIVCYRGCPHETRIKEGGRVFFRSLAEAETGGYRACLVCMPGPTIITAQNCQ